MMIAIKMMIERTLSNLAARDSGEAVARAFFVLLFFPTCVEASMIHCQ